MGTQSYIWIELEDSDKGKFIKADKNKLFAYKEWNEATPKFRLRSKYIGIYCNYDGYIDSVGKELYDHYNTKEKVLNLIACGHCSSVLNEVVSYLAWQGRKTIEHNRPFISDEEPHFLPYYTYLFKNGEWYVKTNLSQTWNLLKDLL